MQISVMLAFLVALIVVVRGGFEAPHPIFIVIVVSAILLLVAAIWRGVVGRISNAIVGRLSGGVGRRLLVGREVLHEAGLYAVVRLTVDEETAGKAASVGDTGLAGKGVSVLAIERGDTVPALENKEDIGSQRIDVEEGFVNRLRGSRLRSPVSMMSSV